MKTKILGLLELACGWIVAVGTGGAGRVRVTLQFDPRREFPQHGVKVLDLSKDEAAELEEALREARANA